MCYFRRFRALPSRTLYFANSIPLLYYYSKCSRKILVQSCLLFVCYTCIITRSTNSKRIMHLAHDTEEPKLSKFLGIDTLELPSYGILEAVRTRPTQYWQHLGANVHRPSINSTCTTTSKLQLQFLSVFNQAYRSAKIIIVS